MENLRKLNSNELLNINGGESFAYRAGQFIAIVSDMRDGGLSTVAGAVAWNDWFG